MKKILSVSIALAILAGCASGGFHAKSTTRQLASTQTVVVNANQDDSAKYPTLAKLCLAARSSDSTLSFATAVISSQEVMTFGLQCSVTHISKGKNAVVFNIAASREVISGANQYKVDEMVRDLYIARNQNEITIAAKTVSGSTYVVDYFLNLNAAAQPVNTKNNFSGVASADFAKSGFYQSQDQDEALKTCILAQDDVQGCLSSVTTGRKVAIQVGGSQLFTSITMPFGWMMNNMPTNTDLDKNAGRVDFAQSIQELTAYIQANYKTQASDVQSDISDAKKAIASAQ
jgi:hypothetical protein